MQLTKSYLALTLFLSFALAACDIEPVSSGIWEIQIEGVDELNESTWNIKASGEITILGWEDDLIATAELGGSRIAWSESFSIGGVESQVNFNGTVSGNALQGTLYTNNGNFTVSGRRQ